MGDFDQIREVEKVKKKTKIEEIGGTETSQIEKLTEDCLIEIFQYLPIADKIRIERVSKKWQSLSQRSWNNFKSLDYSVKTWGVKEHPYRQKIIKSINFDKIIRLSGRYLTSICTNAGNFGRICHLLPNIQELQLLDDCPDKNTCPDYNNERNLLCTYSYDAWKKLFSWLMFYGKNITKFKIELNHLHYEAEDFARFFRQMKQLKSLQLGNADCLDWSDSFILELPLETMQEIILRANYITAFDDKLPMIIKKCKQLETFCTTGAVISKKVGLLEALTSQAASLKNLGMNNCSDVDNQTVLLSTMSLLTNLEKLDLSYQNFLSDTLLVAISQNCKKLTYLNLSNCRGITDRGVSSICNIDKLTYLSLRESERIINPPLEKLTKLVVLDAYESRIEEECLCTFLKKAHRLRALNVAECPQITNKLLDVAIEVAKFRNSSNDLDVYIAETGISMNTLDEQPSFLNITSSLCMELAMEVTRYGIKDPFMCPFSSLKDPRNILVI